MRLFVAVDLPPWIIRAMYATQHELPPDKVKLVKQDNMHITLKFLGEVQMKKIESVAQRLGCIEHKKTDAVVYGAGAFPDENYVKVVWAQCKSRGLDALAEKIEKALPEFKKEKYFGHITIARVERKIDLKKFFDKYRKFRFGDFDIKKFYLMESVPTASGPKYHAIAEYELK